MSRTRVAAIQVASGPNLSANLAEAERLIGVAARDDAQLVVLPEHFAMMAHTDAAALAIQESDGAGRVQEFLSRQASSHGVWLCGGLPLQASVPDKFRASCLLYDDTGARVARYDKIHLFDATIAGETPESYTESDQVEGGAEVCIVETPFGRMGLAASYDLRFPELFRLMSERGVELFVLPASFTAITGRAHWDVLVRARAIENLSYVVAAAQGGFHVSGRETHGDSMIVDPWGNVLGRLPKGPGVIVREIDVGRLDSLRKGFPTLDHVRIKCEVIAPHREPAGTT